MSVRDEIFEILSKADKEGYVYYEKKVNDELIECDIEDDIVGVFITAGIKEYNVEKECMFENPGINIYSISIAWIENGKLETILNWEIDT